MTRLSVLLRTFALAAVAACSPASVMAAELIMYELPGCPYCRQWLHEVGPGYPETAEGRLAPLRRHMKTDPPLEGVSLSEPVTVVPTFVLVEAGHEVGRITGFVGSEFFYPMLDELIARLPAKAGTGKKAVER